MSFKMANETDENQTKEEKGNEKPNIEGFLTDTEMGLKYEMPKRHTETRYEKKIELSREEFDNISLAISRRFNRVFPGYEIEISPSLVNMGPNAGELVIDAISYVLKKDGKPTGDELRIGRQDRVSLSIVKFEADGNKAVRDAGFYFLANVVDFVTGKGYRFNDTNLDDILNPVVAGALKLAGIIIEAAKKEPEKLKCEAGSYDFLSKDFLASIKGEIENIVAEKGGLLGLTATEEYKDPDSTNAGIVEITKKDPRFDIVRQKYGGLWQLTTFGNGEIIITDIVEAYHSKEERIKKQKLNEALSLSKNFPLKYKQIVEETVKGIENSAQNSINKSKTKLKGG